MLNNPSSPPSLLSGVFDSPEARQKLQISSKSLPVHKRQPTVNDTDYATGALWRSPDGSWFTKRGDDNTGLAAWVREANFHTAVGAITNANSTVAFAYGLCRIVPSYVGPLVDIVRQDGGSLIVGQTIDGYMDLDAVISFADGNAVWVTKLYAQDGTSNHGVQLNVALCPRLDYIKCNDRVPCLNFDGRHIQFVSTQQSINVSNVGATIYFPVLPAGIANGASVSSQNMSNNKIINITSTTITLANTPAAMNVSDPLEIQFSTQFTPSICQWEAHTYLCKTNYKVKPFSNSLASFQLAPHLPWWVVQGLIVTGTNVPANTFISSCNPDTGSIVLTNTPTGPVSSITLNCLSSKMLDFPNNLQLHARNHTVMMLARRPNSVTGAAMWTIGANSSVAVSSTQPYVSMQATSSGALQGTGFPNAQRYYSYGNNMASAGAGFFVPDTFYSQRMTTWISDRSGIANVAWSGLTGNTITVPAGFVTFDSAHGIGTGAIAFGSNLVSGTTVTAVSGNTITFSSPPSGNSGFIEIGNAAQIELYYDDRYAKVTSSLSTSCSQYLSGGSIGTTQQGIGNSVNDDWQWGGIFIGWNGKLSSSLIKSAKISVFNTIKASPQISKYLLFAGSSLTYGNVQFAPLGPPETLIDMIRDYLPYEWYNVGNGATIAQDINNFSYQVRPILPYIDHVIIQPGIGNSLQQSTSVTLTANSSGANLTVSAPGAGWGNSTVVPKVMISHANITPGTYIQSINTSSNIITLSAAPTSTIVSGQVVNIINDNAAFCVTNIKYLLQLYRQNMRTDQSIFLIGQPNRATFVASNAPGSTLQETDYFTILSDIGTWYNTKIPGMNVPYADFYSNSQLLSPFVGTSTSVPTPWDAYPEYWSRDKQHPQNLGSRLMYAPIAKEILRKFS